MTIKGSEDKCIWGIFEEVQFSLKKLKDMNISESDAGIMRLASFVHEGKLTEFWCKIKLLGSNMEVSCMLLHRLKFT